MTTGVISKEFLLPKGSEDFVGEVVVDVELSNLYDEAIALRGLMPKEDVRRIRLPMIVDTGANMLVLPEEVVDKLGLRILDYTPVEYADGRIEQRPIASRSHRCRPGCRGALHRWAEGDRTAAWPACA